MTAALAINPGRSRARRGQGPDEWAAQQFARLGQFSGIDTGMPGLFHRFDEVKTQGARAAKHLFLKAFPELADRLENPRFSHEWNVFIRNCCARLIVPPPGHINFVQICGPLNYTWGDDDLKDFAENLATVCRLVLARSEFPALELSACFAHYGLETDFMRAYRFKRGQNAGQIKPGSGDGWEARAGCAHYWRRQLRKVSIRAVERLARETGLTNKRAGCYVSEYTYRSWQASVRRNQLCLQGMEAENDNGQVYQLDELAALGVADPVIRRGELMVRVRGFEEWAAKQGGEWVPMFYTITCPSRFHAFTEGRINGKFDGSTPAEAQSYLCDLWARFRATCGRARVGIFGFRVAEPHHCGCPHWHILLFVPAGRVAECTGALRALAFSESPDEPGAAAHRFTSVEIDTSKGSAAGYIAKYISKNIDGFNVGRDYEAGAWAESSAKRVRAWASTWGIRQFQQIGGPPVSVWRELRRLANMQERWPEESQRDDTLEAAMGSADAGDWCGFVDAMGGAVARRDERPIGLFWTERTKLQDGARVEKRGRYGDAVPCIRGLWAWCFPFPLLTRVREWAVRMSTKVVGRKLHEVAARARAIYQNFEIPRAPPALALDLCK